MNDKKVRAYAIPKKEEQYVQKREDHIEEIMKQLCNMDNIRKNAKMVVGCNIIETDSKFIDLLDEGYKCFLIGLYNSTVALCSMAVERLCYDLVGKSEIKFHDKILNDKEKQFLFKMQFSAIVQFLTTLGLINDKLAKEMRKLNDIRNTYVHPILEGDAYEDAKKSINHMCNIIDSLIVHSADHKTNMKNT